MRIAEALRAAAPALLLATAIWSGVRSVQDPVMVAAAPLTAVAEVQADRYWTLYILYPVWIFVSYGAFNDPRVVLRRMRAGSRTREMMLTVRRSFPSALAFSGLATLAGVVVVAGLALGAPTIMAGVTAGGIPGVLLIVMQFGKTILVLVLLTLLVHGVQYAIGSVTWRLLAIAFTWFAILVTASTAAWWSTTSLWIVDASRPWTVGLATNIVLGALLAGVFGFWRIVDARYGGGVTVDARPWAAAVVGGVLVVLAARQATARKSSVMGALDRAFGGGGVDGISIVSMATYALLTVLPALFVGFTLTDEFRRRAYILGVRFGTLRSFGRRFLSRVGLLGAGVGVSSALVAGVSSVLFGGQVSVADAVFFVAFAGASALQIVVLGILFASITLIVHDVRLVYLSFLAVLVLSLPSINSRRIMPFGLNLTRGLGIEEFASGVVSLCVWAVIGALVVSVALQRPRTSRWILGRM